MKKALITGITGQDGSYLAEFLLKTENLPRHHQMTLGWKKLIARPILAAGMYALRFLVGVKYLLN